MDSVITFVLSNFTLSFLVLGLVTAGVSIKLCDEDVSSTIVFDRLCSHFVLFSIGFSFLYNFIMHVFFPEMAAEFIGWKPSPFQLEVGYASLGFSVVGFMGFKNKHLRLAAIVGPAFFLWGAASGHIYQIVVNKNMASGNAGIILYTDILLPLIGFFFNHKSKS
ncbi:hypothetical protein HOG98_05340 [bacterium]|nr:hypothetical protein [bacterium]